jgi:phage gp29-like protein
MSALAPTIDMTGMSAADLSRILIKRRLPQSEKQRTYFGRSIDMARIEVGLRQADYGIMYSLCDMESEALALDPHLSSTLSKRFRAVQALDWDLELPTGPDVDKVEAQLIADKCRSDFKAIPFFTERLYDLLWANYDGRAALENHWARRSSGRFPWHICELGWVHPRRLSFGPARELRIINPARPRGDFQVDGLAVDDFPGKFLWWMPRLFREYPEREGLGPRTLYWAFFKRFSWRTRMIWTEVFGVPWRVVTIDKDAQGADLDEAREAAEDLGQESTAAFPPGVSCDIQMPDGENSDHFSMSHDQVNQEMSKLVLGNTGTTDAEANRAESIVHKGEQNIFQMADSEGVGERLTNFLVHPTAILNFGPDSIPNAPSFVLRSKQHRDLKSEQERADKAIAIGVPVAVSQYREIAGVREPEPDEPYIVQSSSGGTDAFGNPTPAETTIIDPKAPPEVQPVETDALEAGGLEQAEENAEQEHGATAGRWRGFAACPLVSASHTVGPTIWSRAARSKPPA